MATAAFLATLAEAVTRAARGTMWTAGIRNANPPEVLRTIDGEPTRNAI